MTATECKSDFKPKTNTPYLALAGELWGVYYEHFEEIVRVITAPHCKNRLSNDPFMLNDFF